MRPALFRHDADRPIARRAVSLAAVVAVHALLLLLLIRAAPEFVPFRAGRPPTILIDLPKAQQEQEQRSETRRRERRSTARREAPLRATPLAAPDAPAEAPTRASGVWSELLHLDHDDYARSDIATLPKSDALPDEGARSAGSSYARSDDQPVGTMPNGDPLYGAEWYREPTDAELSTYAPKGVEGWGMIGCKTVPGYRVEDCEELGQSPPGSGLARAVREAAWQFRVRPPRVGGRPLTGTWVRIRIDFRISHAG